MDLENAIAVLNQDGYTCVLAKGGVYHTSRERGVKPLMDLLERGGDYTQFSAADKVIGKATAFLYVHLGIKRLYGQIVSQGASEVLSRYGVEFTAGQLVPAIMNRRKDGYCPMESSVIHVGELEDALPLIFERYRQLNSK